MFYVYILRCRNASPYVGYTQNIEARARSRKVVFEERPVRRNRKSRRVSSYPEVGRSSAERPSIGSILGQIIRI